MLRRVALACLFACAFPAQAGDAPATPSQFLDKSLVTIPKNAGNYSLLESQYDPAAFNLGISTSWRVAGAPDSLTVSLYVYPIGRGAESDVVLHEIADVEAAVREALRQGLYSDLVVGDRQSFLVVAREATILDDGKEKGGEPPAAFDPTPKEEPVLEPSDKSDPLLAAIASSMASPNSHGQRQAFRFSRNGVARRSLGYVFYRHLFGFKVRVSAPEQDLDQAAFEAVADAAVRNLVPRIDVINFGSCGTITLPAGDKKADKDAASQTMAGAMIHGMARIKAENCANSAGDRPHLAPADSERTEIVYPPGTWKES